MFDIKDLFTTLTLSTIFMVTFCQIWITFINSIIIIIIDNFNTMKIFSRINSTIIVIHNKIDTIDKTDTQQTNSYTKKSNCQFS